MVVQRLNFFLAMVYRSNKQRLSGNRWYLDRISLLKWCLILLFAVVLARLFQLQVVDYQAYSDYAEQRMQDKTIPARRGRILLKDGSNDFFELANNVSLELLFADPYLIKQRVEERASLGLRDSARAQRMSAPTPTEIARQIAPILFEMVKE
ncbi:MAG: hypothetical protein Q8P95_02990, partial [bacterium]|nr:hypothetical protein [bacterium]